MKKLFAVCLACVMTLCLLAGCGNETAAPQTNPGTNDETTPVVKDPTPAGMLLLSAGASLNVSYDADGLVLKIDGNNETGIELTEKYTDYLGKTCSVVVKELITASAEAGYLTPHDKNIVIKQALRSQLPTEFFLETIETEAKAAAEAAGSTAAVALIDESILDEHGYITLATVKALLSSHLGVAQLDKYYGGAVPIDGFYICTVEVAGVRSYHKIDAVTGLITDATADDLLGDPENSDESFEDELTEDEPVIEESMPDELLEDDNT